MKIIIRIKILRLIHIRRAIHYLFRFQSPAMHIFVHRLFIKICKKRVCQITSISRPLIHFQTSLHHIKISIQIIPEFLVISIVSRRRFIITVYLPIGTPVFFFTDIFHKTREHILIMSGKTQNLSAHRLMRHIAHTESLALR